MENGQYYSLSQGRTVDSSLIYNNYKKMKLIARDHIPVSSLHLNFSNTDILLGATIMNTAKNAVIILLFFINYHNSRSSENQHACMIGRVVTRINFC